MDYAPSHDARAPSDGPLDKWIAAQEERLITVRLGPLKADDLQTLAQRH